jgi:hypothetical protein
LAIVYRTYFAVIGWWLTTTPADEIVYQPLLVVAVVPSVLLAAVSHIGFALANPQGADAHDERDRLISLRGERVGGYVLAAGVFAGLVLTMVEVSPFFITHASLLMWVVAEIIAGATRIVLFRRGT